MLLGFLAMCVGWAADPAPRGGIGALVTPSDVAGFPAIALPIAGSPAEKAGLLPGDVVRRVDGWSTEGQTLEDVISHIGGADGTDVALAIDRDGALLDIAVRRAQTAALAAEQARVQRELCPALHAALKSEDPLFTALRGEASADGESFTATPPLATAALTRVELGFSGATWRAQLGTYASATEAVTQLDAAVARFRPCLTNHWVVRERDPRTGRPVVYFGRESGAGWHGAAGAFRARTDNVVDVYVEGGRPTLYANVHGAPRGPWVATMLALVAAAENDFRDLRGAVHTDRAFINANTWYDATTALPGAADCRVNVGGSMTPSDPYYQCTVARNVAPEEVGPAFDKTVSAVQATLGSGWVQWMDPAPAPHDRHFRRFAKRTTRGFEETAVITVGLSETGVTVSVAKVGLSS